MQTVSVLTCCSTPPRNLKDIEEQLESLFRKPVPLQDVNKLLDDLQEAIGDYMVRPSP